MKKISIIILVALSLFTCATAQNVDDALRYSQVFYSGTARFMSMGGAFTALGGDLSAIGLNPAGTGVFRSSELSITPQLFYNNKSSVWNNQKSSAFSYVFNLSQIGIVSNLISTGNETGLVSLNVAYAFNKTNSYDENFLINGTSNNSSMADYWAIISNGKSKANIPDNAKLALGAALIDTLSGSNTLYGTIFSSYGDNADPVYGQKIKREITNSGFTGEHAFSIGANYSNKYFFGATLGISSLRYTGHIEHLESDDANVIYDFKSFTYTDHLEATGTGYSLKIGTIIKPTEYLRIGLALHSPVVYRITENYFDNTTSHYDFLLDGVDTYENSNNPTPYKYTFTTPFRFNTGAALQIKKIAMISADYEFVDYSKSQFSKAIDNQSYSSENDSIASTLKAASNFRIGGELRLNNIYLRTGYSYYGKPIKSGYANKDLNYNTLSFGIGFRQQSFYFDLAYTILASTSKDTMYFDPGYLQPATVKTIRNTFAATLGYKFGY